MADLGDRAFLRLWSYPNLYFNKKKNNKGDGKELCDLLVVCGDDIIIFSDKSITWHEDALSTWHGQGSIGAPSLPPLTR